LNLLSRVASALEHSQYDVQFQAYSKLIFAFAFIMLVAEAVKGAALRTDQGLWLVLLVEAARIGAVVALLLCLRPSGLWATSAAERLMWSVWIGYVLTLYIVGFAHWIVARQRQYLVRGHQPVPHRAVGSARHQCGGWGWKGQHQHLSAAAFTDDDPFELFATNREARVRVEGGSGPDTINVNLANAPTATFVWDVAIFGGSDMNNITFNGNNQMGGTPSFGPSGAVLIDGGLGESVATVSGNFPVVVQNAELL
jgi:hypothetical protein